MATLERYLEALQALKATTAEESLNPQATQKTEYQFGFVCGVQAGLKLAEELLNNHLSEQDEDDGIIKRTNQARRAR